MQRYETVELTNLCMVYDDHGNVLVQEKILPNGTGLIFPGGHVEKHEPIVDAMIREMQEETGLHVSNLQFCGIKDFIYGEDVRYIVFLYKTNSYTGKLHASREGRMFWIPLEELKKRNDTLWRMDKMLNIFCEDQYTELFFDKGRPILK